MDQIAFQQERPPARSAAILISATVAFVAVLVVFWFIAKRFAMEARVGGHMGSAFACFALLLAPYWFFAFGLADLLRRVLHTNLLRVCAPALLVIPYLIFTLPRGEFRAVYALLFITVPMFLSAIFVVSPSRDHGLCWQDVVALVTVGIPIEFGILRGAFPHSGLGVLPKFLLMDALLYAYLVVRNPPGIGFDLKLRWRDLGIGLREWAFFAPIAILLGTAIHFIKFRAYWPDPGGAVAGWVITFFFVALPEEFFFRGLLQNLLERRLRSRHQALLIASVIFGLSHFNKPLPFNWRYVILASIAGIFYGRAWLDRRRLASTAIAHATVDLVWGLWFRLGP